MSLFRALSDGLEVRYRHEVIHVQAWGPNSLRVRAAIHAIAAADHGALGEPPGASTCSVVIDGDCAEAESWYVIPRDYGGRPGVRSTGRYRDQLTDPAIGLAQQV